MSDDERVEVPFDGEASDKAVLLLAAAEELGYDQAVVGTTEGAFVVPKDVHDRAFPPAKADKKKSTPKKAQE